MVPAPAPPSCDPGTPGPPPQTSRLPRPRRPPPPPRPYARLRGEGALGPAPASRLPALPSRSPLRTRVSSSPRTLRGRRAGGGGAAPGTAAPYPPPHPGRHHPGQIGQSAAAQGGGGLRRAWRGSGCKVPGGDGPIPTCLHPGFRSVSQDWVGGGGAASTCRDPPG